MHHAYNHSLTLQNPIIKSETEQHLWMPNGIRYETGVLSLAGK